jgi:hypothetical protein
MIRTAIIRISMLCALACAPALAQTSGAPAMIQPNSAQPSPAQPSSAQIKPGTQTIVPAMPPGIPPRVQPVPSPADLMPPDTVVITVRGLCPKGQNAVSGKSDGCAVAITKEQFNQMIAAMNVASQTSMTPAVKRNFAASYVHEMALAAAAEKAGVDKDPRFAELMEIVRVRTLAAAYSRSLEEKFSAPSPEEVEAYYKQNISRFEQVQLDRIFVPRINSKKPNENRAEFEKKARNLADQMRDRAAKGEDADKLQAEVYTTLGLSNPPPTNFGFKRKGAFPPVLEQELFSLSAGQVSKVQSDPAGFTIYRVRSHDALPLASLKDQLSRELTEKNREAAVRAVLGDIQPDFNEKFFAVNDPSNAPVVPRAMPKH